MGIYSWDLEGSFSTPQPVVRTPRLTVHCEYPDTELAPTVVTFRLSPSYGPPHGLWGALLVLVADTCARGVQCRDEQGRGAAAVVLE